MTSFRFSKRSAKYVWLSLPGLLSLLVTFGWAVSIAPSAQENTRRETQWKAERRAQKERADFLDENRIHSDYDQVTMLETNADDADLIQVITAWRLSPTGQAYRHGQIIRLLDQHHQCFGYLWAGFGLYFESQNPGLCDTANPDVEQTLKTSNGI